MTSAASAVSSASDAVPSSVDADAARFHGRPVGRDHEQADHLGALGRQGRRIRLDEIDDVVRRMAAHGRALPGGNQLGLKVPERTEHRGRADPGRHALGHERSVDLGGRDTVTDPFACAMR